MLRLGAVLRNGQSSREGEVANEPGKERGALIATRLLEVREFYLPLRCFDTEDVEGLLVDLGVGHFDQSGYYHEYLDPEEELGDTPDLGQDSWN